MREIIKLNRDKTYKDYKLDFPELDVPGTYAWRGTSGKIKWGSAKKSILQRLLSARTDLEHGEVKVIGFIPTSNTNATREEQRAHNHFLDFATDGEWYHAIPTKIIHDYIHYRQGQIYENELILQRRCKTEVPTLWGNEKAVKFRPKCYFYPELPAQNTVEAGTGENWRSYCARHVLDEAGIRGNPSFFMRRGRPRVYVSQKYHNEQLRKNKLIKEVKGTLEDYFTK